MKGEHYTFHENHAVCKLCHIELKIHDYKGKFSLQNALSHLKQHVPEAERPPPKQHLCVECGEIFQVRNMTFKIGWEGSA